MASAPDHCDHPFVSGETPATGTTGIIHSAAARANLTLDRDHWSFDPEAYRESVVSNAYSPSVISSVLLVLTCFCCVVMAAIALGAQ